MFLGRQKMGHLFEITLMAAILFSRHFEGFTGVGEGDRQANRIQHPQIMKNRWSVHFYPKMPLGVTFHENPTCLIGIFLILREGAAILAAILDFSHTEC